MLTRLRLIIASVVVAGAIAGSAYAQEISEPVPAPAPANLTFVEGTVDVVQGGVSELADPPMMLLEGDLVRTRSGRAEIVFGDGTILHVAPDSIVELMGEQRLRLQAGRMLLRVSQAVSGPYAIDTPLSSVRLDAQGEYLVNVDRGGRLQVSVARGVAQLLGAQAVTVGGGQTITMTGTDARPWFEPFNSAQWDSFATWSHERVNGVAFSLSATQLPYELRPYAPVLDRHGRWDYVAPHGYVWFPSVGMSWRPYYDGAWSFTRYGWTWHGRDRWAWPTHHYGRWGFTGSFWYWIPARTWAPAWVRWSVDDGYVSWAPLGWHTVSNPWRGWTVLPRRHFGPRQNVRTYAVDGDRLSDAARQALLARATPVRPEDDFAVPRDSVGVRGNVRRPPYDVRRPPAAIAPRDADRAPARVTDAPPRSERDDHPAYAPGRSWSGASTSARGNGERTGTAKEPAGARERRGAVREPPQRQSPRGSEARPPRAAGAAAGSSRSKPSGAAGGSAVPRTSGTRPKGKG
jgi:hypothetical protein